MEKFYRVVSTWHVRYCFMFEAGIRSEEELSYFMDGIINLGILLKGDDFMQDFF